MLHAIFDDEKWSDVTDLLKQAVPQLQKGEMIQGASFSMSEAMSCLELMDPKMDSGMGEPDPVAEDLFDENKVLLEPTHQELVAIFDEFMRCEMSWQEGNNISQTLFCFPCMMVPSRVRHPLLRAIVYSYLKTSKLIKNIIIQADVHEEEDFVNNFTDLQFGDDETSANVAEMLRTQEHSLNASVAASEWHAALLARIKFRRAYHAAHVLVGQVKATALNQAKVSIKYALEQLEIIERTDAGNVPDLVFYPTLNRHLLGPSPPKTVAILPRAEAIAHLRRLLEQMFRMCDMAAFTSLDQFQDILFEMSIIEPQPTVLSRSHLRHLILKDGVTCTGRPLSEYIRLSMLESYIPAAVLEEEGAVNLIHALTKNLLLCFHSICFNRGRQRRRLQRLMENFQVWQQDGDTVDLLVFGRNAQDRPMIFAKWMLDQLLRVGIHFLELGLQLRLYSDCELIYIYWYLDYLNTVHSTTLPPIGYTEPSKAKKDKKLPAAMIQKTEAKTHQRLNAIRIKQLMCRAAYRVLAALTKHDLVFSTPEQLSYISSRYTRRFSPIFYINNIQPLTYEQFQQNTDLSQFSVQSLYQSSLDTLKEIKGIFDSFCKSMPHVKPLQKIVVTNSVAIGRLMLKDETQKKSFVNLNFGSNLHFFTIQSS